VLYTYLSTCITLVILLILRTICFNLFLRQLIFWSRKPLIWLSFWCKHTQTYIPVDENLEHNDRKSVTEARVVKSPSCATSARCLLICGDSPYKCDMQTCCYIAWGKGYTLGCGKRNGNIWHMNRLKYRRKRLAGLKPPAVWTGRHSSRQMTLTG
jgi:hypothetical protein